MHVQAIHGETGSAWPQDGTTQAIDSASGKACVDLHRRAYAQHIVAGSLQQKLFYHAWLAGLVVVVRHHEGCIAHQLGVLHDKMTLESDALAVTRHGHDADLAVPGMAIAEHDMALELHRVNDQIHGHARLYPFRHRALEHWQPIQRRNINGHYLFSRRVTVNVRY